LLRTGHSGNGDRVPSFGVVFTSHALRVAASTLQTLTAGPSTIQPGKRGHIVDTGRTNPVT